VERTDIHVSVSDRFVSRTWLGAVPFVVWALLAALTGGQLTVTSNPHPGFFLVLAIVMSLMGVYAWTLARPNMTQDDLWPALRRIALSQGAIGVVAAAVLAAMGHPGSAILSAVIGLVFSVACWPWSRTLRRNDAESHRAYRRNYFLSSLLVGLLLAITGLLGVIDLAVGPEPTGVAARMAPSDLTTSGAMLALALQMFVLAWDERRRPRRRWSPAMPPSSPAP
jgi:hypothetical protein